MIDSFNKKLLSKLYIPPSDTHKGQNGKLLIIGGSRLFHAASLWALQIASKIVDMVFYSSVPENNVLVEQLKREFRNGIIVRREDIESYIEEADAVLIGPGMVRAESGIMNYELGIKDITEINQLEDEGEQTYYLTKYLLQKYPQKKWIIDAGALQMLEPEWLLPLEGRVVVTPHHQEFERVFCAGIRNQESGIREDKVRKFAEQYNCIILLKGLQDVICSSEQCMAVAGGNAGMTKGGQGMCWQDW